MAFTAIRERRRTLRYRNLLVRQMVQMKNKISGLLMEAGVNYNKQATDALPENPKKETKKLDKDIEKLFKNFPPK